MKTILDLIAHDKLTLKPAEAAELMSISLPTLYDLIKSETANFPAIRVGVTGRGIIIPTISLLKWLDLQAGGDGDLSYLPYNYRSVAENLHFGNRDA